MVIGLAWRHFLRPRLEASTFDFILLALMVAAAMVFFGELGSSGTMSGPTILLLTLLTCIGAVLSLGWMMRREDRLRRREGELRIDALTDPLTGLGNRRAFAMPPHRQQDTLIAPFHAFLSVPLRGSASWRNALSMDDMLSPPARAIAALSMRF